MAAGATRWRKYRGAVLFAILLQVVNGYEEIHTISQLSPKSVGADQPLDVILQTTPTENLAFRIEPSIKYDDLDDIPPEDIITDEETEKHVIVARSAVPTDRESRSINYDDIPSSNNEIDNELELHNKRKYYEIHPTKTSSHSQDNEIVMSSGDKFEFNFPGEARRAPKARALPLGPRIRPTAVQPMYATLNPNEPRQNTEIQNIITGIVKLLNGNVNVQANTQLLRPGRPMNSRINNRGPPRISDVAPIDFEKPITPPTHAYHPTKTPPPYPFDRPHHGVNLPEQIVPPLNYRPGLTRPIPPWQRPRPRPPYKRPNPGLPIYRPTLQPMPVDIPNFDDEDLKEDAENDTNHDNHLVHDDKEVPLTNLPVANTTEENEREDNKLTTAPDTTSSTSSSTTTTTTTTTERTTTSTTSEKPETTTETPTTTEKPTTEKAKTTTEKQNTTEQPQTTEKPKTTTERIKITTEKIKTTTEKAKVEKKTEKDKKKEPLDNKKDKFKVEEKPTNKTKLETIIDMIESSIEENKASLAASIAAATPTDGLMSHAPTVSGIENADSVIITSSSNAQPLPSSPYRPYRRPGIVLDDTDFKPTGSRFRPDAPVVTAPAYGEIFDVTLSAIQGPGEKGATVRIENVNPIYGHGDRDDIIVTASGEQGFVSIDGKRTYLNLFDTSSSAEVKPTRVQSLPHHSAPPELPESPAVGTGVAVPADDVPLPMPPRRPTQHRPPPYRRPQPTVRIDTCIVGDDSTCDQAQNEKCRTEAGISSCQCRPGYARRVHRDPCRRVVALILNLRVDRLYKRKIAWDAKLADKESEPYQQLSYEAIRAIDSAFSMTPFSDDFVSGSVNSVHRELGNQGIYVNYTILMQETPETIRPAVAGDIQRHILGVLDRRSNNVGSSELWVDSPAGSVAPLKDVDECASPEYNDCHKLAYCMNTWGGFRCECPDSTLDANTSPLLAGRECRACSNSHCNDRGTCSYSNKKPHCSCMSGYYGSTCEVDGEVVGVAVGASLAAALVIALTLAALLSWSRKWSREQKAAGMGSPVFNYMTANTIKTPPVGAPPYQVTLEERMRWAQIAEAMAQSNHYAAEPNQMATRPSSAMFGGYPTLPPVPMPRLGLHSGHHTGTINTIASRANTASHHNLYGYTNHMATESTSSEASSHVQERADLLVPRPKSRARSMHNQTGIYYDVDYENAPEAIYGTKGIPLSTYTVSRGPPFYRS
ncbi:calcium-binding EGF-like domain-containing protein pawn [Choristoneura fumiferana]|uniref:calcium-binding EGF-like domain-containing protein pawn n=1 Tax=Choristoneura fumiferana TaxID=7141 RepID=UPI003D15B99C